MPREAAGDGRTLSGAASRCAGGELERRGNSTDFCSIKRPFFFELSLSESRSILVSLSLKKSSKQKYTKVLLQSTTHFAGCPGFQVLDLQAWVRCMAQRLESKKPSRSTWGLLEVLKMLGWLKLQVALYEFLCFLFNWFVVFWWYLSALI